MMYARIASVAVCLAAVVLVGAGLGSYTVGGVSVREPVDVIGNGASRVPDDHFASDATVQAPITHVCRGCDAQLHREDTSYKSDASYDTDDEWAREERDNRETLRLALADRPHAEESPRAVEADADVVVDKDLLLQTRPAVAGLDD